MVVQFNNVILSGGTSQPDLATNRVISVGDATGGSDQIVVQSRGGFFEGVVEIGSAIETPLLNRWFFRDQKRSPNPGTLRLLGTGAHPLVEWSNNLNFPLNQYRAGQAFIGSLGKAEEAYLWRHVGDSLINTGQADAQNAVGGAIGKNFTITGFPAKMTVTGLAVFIDKNSSATATTVEWFSDSGFVTSLGSATIAADRRGLVPVVMNDATKWQTLAAGELYVRLTKPATGQETEGALVIFYFPYTGS